MKNLSVVLSSLALVGVIILFGMKMSGGNVSADVSSTDTSRQMLKVAYVDFDTLQTKDAHFNKRRDELEAKKKKMTDELERSQKKMQDDYVALQRKAQAGTLTQAEAEAGDKKLMQMQKSLQARETAMTEELYKEQEAILDEWQNKVDSFFATYNKNKKYDYILGYSKSVKTIMYAKQMYDITDEVVEGINKMNASLGDGDKK